MAQSCAPLPTKKLTDTKNKQQKKNINKKKYNSVNKTLIDNHDNHQGGILPADSFPFCASFSRRFATKTGFLIPEEKGTIITGLAVHTTHNPLIKSIQEKHLLIFR